MRTIAEDIKANEQAYEELTSALETVHPGQWVVVMDGRLIAVASTREEALRQAGPPPPAALSRLVREVGAVLPKAVRKL